MKEPDKTTDSMDRLSALIVCRNMEIEELVEQNRNYVELIKSLVSSLSRIEILQSQSYEFLNDDKKMAEHFRLQLPIVQGIDSRVACQNIHEYVLRKDYDKEAAKEALMDVHGRLCLEEAL